MKNKTSVVSIQKPKETTRVAYITNANIRHHEVAQGRSNDVIMVMVGTRSKRSGKGTPRELIVNKSIKRAEKQQSLLRSVWRRKNTFQQPLKVV